MTICLNILQKHAETLMAHLGHRVIVMVCQQNKQETRQSQYGLVHIGEAAVS